jgi:alpha-1,3-rhamnosyl/mannosyltransferase
MVLELHDLRAFDDRWLRLSARGVYQRYLLPQSIKRVGRVVTPTNYGARVITARLGVEGETIQVVTGAAGRVDHAPRVEEVEDFRRRFGVDEPYILALGHLERRKNLGLLIDAVRLLDQTTGSTHRLVLVGDDHGIKDELRRRAAAAPAIDLTMTGRLAEPLKWAAIAGATCLVMPSLVEGFGIVSVEAMSVGCPVLAANAAAIPEVAGNAALLFNPTDAGDLCDRLQQFLADTELQARMVQLGYRRSAELTWEDAADQLHGVYSALAASGVR